MRILVVGDSYCPSAALAPAFEALRARHEVTLADIPDDHDWVPSSASDGRIREYLGSPTRVIELLDGHDILVVQGAPVTDAVLDAAPGLRLLGIARGGPVNVDVAAATERRVPVVITPGKNAIAVAELTLAFGVMLLRRVPEAQRHVDAGLEFGHDNYEGAHWFGRELAGSTIGLVGFGHVGRCVAERAIPLGMRVLAFDPHVEAASIEAHGAEPVSLDTLLAQADIVSLHARGSGTGVPLIGARELGRMRPGATFINTARDTLVDEGALHDALASGRLAGAALDVVSASPGSGRHRLLAHANVIIVPHIGGATHETLARGGEMVAAEIVRLERGEPLVHLANPEVLRPVESAR
jgi:D-3-phosphoglycerate dehydrogenase / 2-oxoglutarate reductase